MVKRYNVALRAWEMGYYQGTRFVVMKLVKDVGHEYSAS